MPEDTTPQPAADDATGAFDEFLALSLIHI